MTTGIGAPTCAAMCCADDIDLIFCHRGRRDPYRARGDAGPSHVPVGGGAGKSNSPSTKHALVPLGHRVRDKP